MIIRRTNYFEKWFNKLSDNIQLIIDKYIKRLVKGNFSTCKSVGEGVHEQKIDFQKGYRIYFTNINGEIIILLLGGDKSTQKKDIEKAKQIKRCLEVRDEK